MMRRTSIRVGSMNRFVEGKITAYLSAYEYVSIEITSRCLFHGATAEKRQVAANQALKSKESWLSGINLIAGPVQLILGS